MTDFCKFERLLVNLGSSYLGGILTFVYVTNVQNVQKNPRYTWSSCKYSKVYKKPEFFCLKRFET